MLPAGTKCLGGVGTYCCPANPPRQNALDKSFREVVNPVNPKTIGVEGAHRNEVEPLRTEDIHLGVPGHYEEDQAALKAISTTSLISSSLRDCRNCKMRMSVKECMQCQAHLCAECDIAIHRNPALAGHKRVDYHATKLSNRNIMEGIVEQGSEKQHQHGGNGHGGDHGHGHGEPVEKLDLDQRDKIWAGIVGFVAFSIVIIMCIWSSAGLMAEHELVHVVETNTRPGHIHATIYRTPADIVLHGTLSGFFEVRLIMMATTDFGAHHRRLAAPENLRFLSETHNSGSSGHTAGHSGHGPSPSPTPSMSGSGGGSSHGHSSSGHGAGGSHGSSPSPTPSSSGHGSGSGGGSSHGHSSSGHGAGGSHGSSPSPTPSSSGHGSGSGGGSSHGHSSSGHGAGGSHGSSPSPTPSSSGHSSSHGPSPGSHTGHQPSGPTGPHGPGPSHGGSHGSSSGSHGSSHGSGSSHAGGHGSSGAHGGHGSTPGAHGGHGGHHKAKVTGNFTYALFADGKQFFNKTVKYRPDNKGNDVEFEEFNGVNVGGLDASGAKEYRIKVTTDRSDGEQAGFLLQVVQMDGAGAWRELIGIIIFVVCFAAIISEKIHRVYSAMLGASAGICAVTAIQETLHLESVVAMIDFGTLMLLFSMMILMKMLEETGFFNWFAVKVVKLSQQNPKYLFFALTYICGILSMFLDNVTCVMLFGPLTYRLCSQMSLRPRYIYLPMAICATIGGTGTLIGDPPNIVIASKLSISFQTFLMYNFPIITFGALPLACGFLYWRLAPSLRRGEAVHLDIEELEKANQITDMPKFSKLCGILGAVLMSLLLAPVHHIEPAWFTVMAMFGGAMLFSTHSIHHYLMAVEWDTLFFFACLFCLVESLSELGVIKMLGDIIADLIMAFPEDLRTLLSVIMLLWVCAFGSAFLESLPFTTTIVYVLLDMQQRTTPGLDPAVLAWPLSVGACVGGIGSIMGSSANLVSMAVSGRQAETEEDKIQGSDFLKYGLPTMVAVIFLCMLWQILLFVIIGLKAA